MATVQTVTVRVSRTTNLGNFNNLKIEAEVVVAVEDGDAWKTVIQGASTAATAEVARATLAELDNIQAGRDAIFAHTASAGAN